MRLDVLEVYIPYEKDQLSNVLIINNDKRMQYVPFLKSIRAYQYKKIISLSIILYHT